MPRILMVVAAAQVDPTVPELLAEEGGLELVSCPDARGLLEQVMERAPDVVIYALRPDCREDLGVLRLMRHAAPEVPLVILAGEDSLETRRVTQGLRPIYYAVSPVDGAELREVVRAAVRRKTRGGN